MQLLLLILKIWAQFLISENFRTLHRKDRSQYRYRGKLQNKLKKTMSCLSFFKFSGTLMKEINSLDISHWGKTQTE